MPSECLKEATTQHYLGDGHGHGPLISSEHVILAVFAQTPHINNRLTPKAFDTGDLKRGNVSLARVLYITVGQFTNAVVLPKIPALGNLVGVVKVDVLKLKALLFEVTGTPKGRAICVLDKVEVGDHNSHACLELSEALSGLTETQKKKINPLVKADLADIFGEIIQLVDALPADALSIYTRCRNRIASFWAYLLSYFR